jgi:hypothetical protein
MLQTNSLIGRMPYWLSNGAKSQDMSGCVGVVMLFSKILVAAAGGRAM